MEHSFGSYLRAKRSERGWTQKELANRLHVTESAVSKWERQLSYPDISLVPSICQELGISEHEFFSACDDEQARLQAMQARRWQRTVTVFRRTCAACYAIALVVCFLCDLILFRALDWFWIVLTSLMLAFSFTNLPFLVRRNKAAVCLGAATVSLFLLLFSCWLFAGGRWIIGALAITALALALPWSWWAVWRLCSRYVLLLSAVLASVWVFILLAVIWVFTGGGWLVNPAFPLAAVGVAFGWGYLACFRLLPAGPWLKAGAAALLTTFAVPVFNCLCAFLLPEQDGPVFLDYFSLSSMIARRNAGDFSWVNILIFFLMLLVSAVLLVIGGALEVRRRRNS